MALAKEFLADGVVGLEKWDAMAPDQIVPERRESVPLLVDVPVERERSPSTNDGALFRDRKGSAAELEPTWDGDGRSIDAFEHSQVEEIVVFEQIIIRKHRTARIFKAVIENGFDPLAQSSISPRCGPTRLPDMPIQADWKHNDLSIGEQFSRK
jgi:hypothetical protein